MKEKTLQTKVGKHMFYLTKNVRHASGAYELKITNGKSIPFSDVPPHQRQRLKQAKDTAQYYKIPDVGFDRKPYDFFCAYKFSYGSVLLGFVVRGKVEHFYEIDIDKFLELEKTSDRKSITEEMASKHGIKHVFPKGA